MGKNKLIKTKKISKRLKEEIEPDDKQIEDAIIEDNDYFYDYSPNMAKISNKESIEEVIEESKSFDEIHTNTGISSKEDIPIEKCSYLNDAEFVSAKKEKNEGVSNSTKTRKTRKSVSYGIFKKICNKGIYKCWNGELYPYNNEEGRFIHLPEEKIKVLIRKGWKEKIQEKLTRNVVLEIMDRLLTEPSFQVEGDCFNKNTHLMNFLNGVLDVETNEFMEHSHDFMFTHCIQANYNKFPKGGHTFRKFIKTAMQNDKEKIEHLQEVVGYILSEYYSAKKALMIIGQPHSGKSTLNRIITTLIGASNVANVPLHRLHERFILAHLSTKKANICSEISDEALSNIEIFKAITGNDDFVAEYKGKDHFTYKSKIKLLFSGNCMPVLKNQDVTTAFFDRLTFINFNYTVPEEDRDKDLECKILEEDKDYIVWWAVEGIKRLISNNFMFSESRESLEFKEKYITEQTHIKDFIENNCKVGIGYKIHLKKLYGYYLEYCHSNCFTPLKRDMFFNEIAKERVEKKKFRMDGSQPLWGYNGITIKTNKELKCG